MAWWTSPICLLALVATQACGYTDAGFGTQSLEVNAALHYAWETDTTRADVWLTRAGDAVQNANVLMTNADTKEQHDVVADEVPGHYLATTPGYAKRLQIHIASDADALVCQIEGPGRHVVSEPAPGTMVGAGTNLPVRWATKDGVRADSVHLSLEGATWSQQLTNDQGKSEVPARVLSPGLHTLTIERRSQMVPEGGSGHSHVDMTYAVSTPFQVRQGS